MIRSPFFVAFGPSLRLRGNATNHRLSNATRICGSDFATSEMIATNSGEKGFDYQIRHLEARAMRTLAAIALTLFILGSAQAHDRKGPNGGRILDAGSFHVELVGKGSYVEVYITDQARQAGCNP